MPGVRYSTALSGLLNAALMARATCIGCVRGDAHKSADSILIVVVFWGQETAVLTSSRGNPISTMLLTAVSSAEPASRLEAALE